MPPTPANAPAPQTVADGIHQLPVLNDNIVWIWVRGNQAVVVDPAVAGPVISWLTDRDLQLKAVLQTHHHADHIGGTPELPAQWPAAAVVLRPQTRNGSPSTVSVREEPIPCSVRSWK